MEPLALQLEATISTWCDRDLDLAGVVLDAGRRSRALFPKTSLAAQVWHRRSPLV